MTNGELRAALYVRVSTADKQKPDAQLNPLRDYAQGRGWHVVDECIDEGVSGVREKRPALDQLNALARRRGVDVVVVAALDRLGRSLPHLLKVLDEWSGLGVQLVSIREGLDFTSPSGRLLFSIVGALATFERDLLRERIKAGIAARRARGLWVGRKPKVTPAVAAEVAARRARGESFGRIAKAMSLPKSTVVGAVRKTCPASAPQVAEMPSPASPL